MKKRIMSGTEEDFGAVSFEETHTFLKKVDNAESISPIDRPIGFSKFPTHICPLGKNCPPDGDQNRCNICGYAIRSVRHIPAIKKELHNLFKKLYEIDSHVTINLNLLTESEVTDLNARNYIIYEDICGLASSLKILEGFSGTRRRKQAFP